MEVGEKKKKKKKKCEWCGGLYYRPGKTRLCPDCLKKYRETQKGVGRDTVLDHYGGKCVCCGENEKSFLTVTNKDGVVAKLYEAGKLGVSDKWTNVIKAEFPKDLQILCYNCIMGRKVNDGVCPHMKSGGISCAR